MGRRRRRAAQAGNANLHECAAAYHNRTDVDDGDVDDVNRTRVFLLKDIHRLQRERLALQVNVPWGSTT